MTTGSDADGHFTVTIPGRHPDNDHNHHHNHPPSNHHHHRKEEEEEEEYDDDELVDPDDPFDIAQTKNAPIETLRRWRVSISSTFYISVFYFIFLLSIVGIVPLTSNCFFLCIIEMQV